MSKDENVRGTGILVSPAFPEKAQSRVGGDCHICPDEKTLGKIRTGNSERQPASRDRLRTDRMEFFALLQGLEESKPALPSVASDVRGIDMQFAVFELRLGCLSL